MVNHENSIFLDIEELRSTLNHFIRFIKNQTKFEMTATTLSKLIYVHKNEYRLMRGFREMKKVNQACNRYKQFSITNTLNNLLDKLNNDKLLPARENLDYVLVKLLGVSKLLCRIITCAKRASCYYLSIIELGHLLGKSMLFLSHLSTLWDSGRNICITVVKAYNNLFEFSCKLKLMKKWLPDTFELPADLSSWLGSVYASDINLGYISDKLMFKKDSNILKSFSTNRFEEEENEEIIENDDNKLNTILKNIIGDKDNSSSDVDDTESNISKERHRKEISNSHLIIKNKSEDSGEIIKRSEIASLNNSNDIGWISTSKDVFEFIRRENFCRSQNTSCATSLLTDKKWKKFRILIKEHTKIMKGSKLVDIFKEEFSKVIKNKNKKMS